ncbi:TPA: XRE family transcriptional regulator, partial [Candidatus Bathyarchaeota archaeon]|nr:XRE family transcriptional regulator [Candidatus Bathyarchaeota archaeon]
MNERLGRYLKKVRKERKLTLRNVEEKTGISNAYLSQVENGKIVKPSPSILYKLAECYNVSYEYLMRLAGYPLPTASAEKEELEPAFRLSSSLADLT